MRVTVRGAASVFVQSGSYQLYVDSVAREGVGDLYLRFEALKKKLAAEGLFDPARKRELPLLPKVIGVATSRSGAVIRDIIRVSRRRAPNVGVLLAPCLCRARARRRRSCTPLSASTRMAART